MTLYDESAACPKCGSKFVTTKHDSERNWMIRQCERCRYWWNEVPLDDKKNFRLQNLQELPLMPPAAQGETK